MAMFAERPYPLEKSLRTLGGVRRGGLAPDDVPTVAVIDDHGARGQAAVTDNAWTLTLPSGRQVSRLEYQAQRRPDRDAARLIYHCRTGSPQARARHRVRMPTS